jgi:hypothetical protein
MIRDLAKSAVSFSWALSLLGVKQAVDLLKPANQRGNNLLGPVIQIAVDQLDDSMKNIYRSGDSLQSRAVDLAFVWINPATWLNPRSWTHPFGCGGQRADANAHNGVTQTFYQPNNGQAQTRSTEGQNTGGTHGGPPSVAPVSNDTAAVGWGPMPVDS